jgi:glycosyltransferase involved in cell wall biosynthesis
LHTLYGILQVLIKEKYMRILHIITRLDKGGSADVLLDLSAGLKGMGHDVYIAAGPTLHPQTDIDAFSLRSGIPVYHIRHLTRDCYPLQDFLSFFEILKIIRKVKPDILHTHTSKAGFIGRIAGRIAGIKVAVHMPHGHVFYGYFNKIKTRIFVYLEKIASMFSDKIVTLTDIEKLEYLDEKIAPDNKIVAIPCGIDVDKFSSAQNTVRNEFGISPDMPVIGWVGRAESVKGGEYFLRACQLIKKEMPHARFLVVGDGSLQGEMEALANSLNLSNEVKFAGYRTDMPEIMNSIDLLLHTPLNEGLGRVILEAMACGKPIVATNVGGIPEIVEHGIHGFLVPPGDCASMAKESLRILKDTELAWRLGNACRKKALNFSTKQMVRKIHNLYSESYEALR